MAQKFKKDDKVIIISGKDKGKTGKILRILPEKEHVVVDGINIIKRHTKPTKESKGGIIELPASLHQSKIMLICPSANKPTRVGFERTKSGVQRLSKLSKETF